MSSKTLRILILAIWCFISSAPLCASISVDVENFAIVRGQTKKIAVTLTNDTPVTAFQFDLYMPEQLSLVSTPGQNDSIVLSERASSTHTVLYDKVSNGATRIVSYSSNSDNFSGTEGAIVYLNVRADSSYLGNATIGLRKILVTDMNVAEHKLSDVSHTFTVRDGLTFAVTYFVDGNTVHVDSVKMGDSIPPYSVAPKEGYTFSGWSEIPAIMPERDVNVYGSFTVNTYAIRYYLNDKPYYTDSLAFGATICPIAAPVQEGYRFSGWQGIPADSIMPAYDLKVYGTLIDGIETTQMDILHQRYYTVEGVPVATLMSDELYIVVTVFTNGSRKTEKVYFSKN